MSTRALIVIAVGAAFAAGFWAGGWSQSVAAADGKVFELRTYTAHEGKLEALQARFRDYTMKLFEKHGIQNVGYWVPVEGEQSRNTLVYLVAHKSREAAEQSWKAFRADPDWQKARAESEKEGPLTAKIERVYLRATPFSPMQ